MFAFQREETRVIAPFISRQGDTVIRQNLGMYLASSSQRQKHGVQMPEVDALV